MSDSVFPQGDHFEVFLVDFERIFETILHDYYDNYVFEQD